MRPHLRIVAIAAVIVVPAILAYGAARHVPPSTAALRSSKLTAHAKPAVAKVDGWKIGDGPDPFALPRRRTDGEPRPLPLRKKYRLDSGFVGTNHVSMSIIDNLHPPLASEVDDSIDRMAGFLSGNGIYAVLQTPSQTLVVNPGDRVDDGRVVTQIRPMSMKLRDDSTVYNVGMRSAL